MEWVYGAVLCVKQEICWQKRWKRDDWQRTSVVGTVFAFNFGLL